MAFPKERHDHTDHIFDRTPVNMTHWNVHVLYESLLQSALQLANYCSTDSDETCTFQCLIGMDDLPKIRLAWL